MDDDDDVCPHGIGYDEECEDCEDEEEDDCDGEYCFTCNNIGIVPCECGGDICVCLNNGEMPCPDCEL